MTAEQLKNEARENQAKLVGYRHYLHAHPETGFALNETVAYVKAQLTQMGYTPVQCGKAGLIAVAGGVNPGSVFMIRGDMDALPIREESDVDFASVNGNMHACGHDLHTSMMLGAARLLKAHEAEIPGTVKLMFQPAEEIFEGSKDMIAHGLLENPDVDAAMMIHVMAGMPFEAGTVIVSSPGVSAPAADYFEIQVQGVGCHGSMPNTGVDPLNAAAHMLIALQEIHAREMSMHDQAILTIGTMHAGTAANAIPDKVTMGGTLRTLDEETRAYIKERMVRIVEGIAQAFRVQAQVIFGSGCPTLVNDTDLSAACQTYAAELLGADKVFSTEQLKALGGSKKSSQTAGSEDFAYVSQKVPAIMLALAAGQPDKGYRYPQHHPMVKFDESILADGSAVYAYTALRWLQDHPQTNAIK